jgi:hypothetical protein
MKKISPLLLIICLWAAIGICISSCRDNAPDPVIGPRTNPSPVPTPTPAQTSEPVLFYPRPEIYQFSFSGEVFGKPLQFDSKAQPQLAKNDIYIGQVFDPQNPRPKTVEVWSEIKRLAVAGRRIPLWKFDLYMPSIPKADFSAQTWAGLFTVGDKPLSTEPFRPGELPRQHYSLLFQISDAEITGTAGQFDFYFRQEAGTILRVLESRQLPPVEGWSSALEVTLLIEGNLYEQGTGRLAGQMKNARLTTRFFYTDVE